MRGGDAHGSPRALPTCDTCRRPSSVCVCDRIVAHPTRLRVLVLQHPQEQDVLLGTAQLLTASLPAAKVVIGLSWKGLRHALDDETADPRRWALLYPDRAGAGASVDPRELEGIVALDGTWSQAKTLLWRNRWLGRLPRLALTPREPSIYGKLRPEPRRECVSTLESVGLALTAAGEDPAVEAGLRRVLRTLVQRVRDAHLPPEARKLDRRRTKREV